MQDTQRLVMAMQIIQANKALESGFQIDQASQNLKEAQGTINNLKKAINNPQLEKNLDDIAHDVFWSNLKLGIWGGLREVVKNFVDEHKIDEALKADLERIVAGEEAKMKAKQLEEEDRIARQRVVTLKESEPIAALIYNSVLEMGEFSSKSPPSPVETRDGVVACAWAVNQVLNHSGIKTLGGAAYLAVKAVEKDLQNGRGIEIRQSEAAAGDITLVDSGGNSQHIGICLNSGCTKVKSNSGSRGQFRWISGAGFDGYYGNAVPKYYRVTKKE